MGAEQGMGRNSLQSKRHNRGLVIGQLLTGVCGSRIELARRTGLSKMTVTNIVADFIGQGMVEECEEQLTKTCGRNPIRLRIGSGAPRVAGLLVQREGIVAALCTLELEVLKTEEVSFLSVSKDQLPVYACEVLDRLLAGESNLLAIGVARAVPVDLRSFLEERYRLPVIVDEDGASAAQAEKLLGAGQEADDFVYVGLGDHISSGIISGGKVLRSARGAGSRLGHISIDRNGPPCSCGGRGCLEMYAGTRVVLGKLWRSAGRKLRFAQFCRLSGVAEIEEVMTELIANLAVALTSMIRLLQPELIILGQDGMEWDDRHVQMLEEAVNCGEGEPVPVRKARFGRDAQLIGAAANVVCALCQGELLDV